MKRILLMVLVTTISIGWGWNDRFIRIVHQSDNHARRSGGDSAEIICGMAIADAKAWGAQAYVVTGDISDTSGAPLGGMIDTIKKCSGQYYPVSG